MKPIQKLPGALNAFRLFVVVRLAYSLLTWLSQQVMISGQFGAPGGPGLPPQMVSLTPSLILPLVGVLQALILFVYLSIPWLGKRLGNWYLPLAVAFATLGPLLENYLFITEAGRQIASLQASIAPVRDFTLRPVLQSGLLLETVALLVPLILIAWMYAFPITAAYSLALPLADLGVFLASGHEWNNAVRLLSISLGRTLLFLLIGYVISRLAADMRQQNLELTNVNRRLVRQSLVLEELAVSRERNRLAREFHDTVAHTLSALAVQLEAVSSLWEPDPAQARALLDQSLGMTRSGLNETRRAIQALRATPLEDLGLAAALAALARGTAERSNLGLDLDLPESVPALPPQVEQCLYRVAEEALRNAALHAQASRLGVSLHQRGRQWTLTVSDDGRGFDPAAPDTEEHFGLRGMRERAAEIGAQLEIISALQQSGTAVRLSWEEAA